MDKINYRLTEYSRGAGCGCKIAPDVLQNILSGSKNTLQIKQLTGGNAYNEDASIWNLENGTSLISTVDFFLPVVDDPYLFGKIAAANALSDIYAMGATPTMALAILGWPVNKIPVEIAGDVLKGAKEICDVANVPVAGGHSIDSSEPVFGLSVNGFVQTQNIKRNSTANEGDIIFITKPIGLGILSSAHKRKIIAEEDYMLMIRWMTELNKAGAIFGNCKFVSALTDITGFGLAGHLLEMTSAKNLSAEIYFDKIPLITNLQTYTDKFIYPDMTMKTYSWISGKTGDMTAQQIFVLCDPQTSGGLMAAVNPEKEKEFIEVLKSEGIDPAFFKPVGKFTAPSEKNLVIK